MYLYMAKREAMICLFKFRPYINKQGIDAIYYDDQYFYEASIPLITNKFGIAKRGESRFCRNQREKSLFCFSFYKGKQLAI